MPIEQETMAENERNQSKGLQHSIFSRLFFTMAQKSKKSVNQVEEDALVLSAVERQTENSRKGGTIWEAVRKADESTFKRLLAENPKNVDARGPVGECPVHMLFLYGTETHLKMGQYLITNFPYTITQIYNLPVTGNEHERRRRTNLLLGILRRSGVTHSHHQT